MRTSHRGPRVQFSGACEQSHWWPTRHTAGCHLLSMVQAATNTVLSVSKPSISQQSQINEDTVEPSAPAREFNLKAYAAITWHNDPASLGLEPRLADHRSRQRVPQRYRLRHWGRWLFVPICSKMGSFVCIILSSQDWPRTNRWTSRKH